ncbi:SpoIIE family protein phosphatase [uncultured Rhodospira sp.]|uniref:SpoIIE family protein phosphatase n=1 Tax=uncultured Rhodospira sp. TaxID=1936189 RepID=UPI002632C485|nr:SpoIIE family protein phosphatase [uncultured Rhodospira sp.]
MPSIRALVVDDNRRSRDMLAGLLKALDYDIALASDGDEAWDLLEREGDSFDVVLLDRRMPRMDGMEVLARIKATPHLQALPVIMQTAADSETEVIEGIRAGVFYYLTKPYQPQALLSVTAAAVADYARVRRLQRDIDTQASALLHLREGRFHVRTLEEASDLATSLAVAFPDPPRQVIGLSELMTNAVEHGNLGITYAEKSDLLARGCLQAEVEDRLSRPEYRDRVVEVTIRREVDRIAVTIADQGEGFNWRDYLEMDTQRVFDIHGRGIALARRISFDSLEYKGRGNEVEASVALPAPANDTIAQPDRVPRSGRAPLAAGAPDHMRLASVEERLIHTHADLQAYRARLDEDLGAAHRMQQDLLPEPGTISALEERHAVRLGSHFESSSELGGDLYGLHPIDAHRFALWMVDFAGHGISAALNTFRLHTLLTEFPEWMRHPGEYLSLLGARLSTLLPTGQYATALYGVVDTQAHQLRYAAAASPPPLIADTATGAVSWGDGSGVPLGVDADALYETRTVPFPPGHMVFLYSDAMLECGRDSGNALGREGVYALLAEAVGRRGAGITLSDVLDPFLERMVRPLSDDLTALMCLRHPRAD